MLPQPKTPDEARRIVSQNVSSGADIIKLFTGSIVTRETVKPMDLEIARAVVDEAHRLGKLVFTHPSNHEGIRVAMDAGVDVLAHTASEGREWSGEFVDEMLRHKVSLVPTLKLWLYEAAKFGKSKEEADEFAGRCVKQLAVYFKAGGRVLFGTDAGYMTDFDPTEEYSLMAESGMLPMAILEALTTAPAHLFGETQKGKVVSGMSADLVVLEKDPTIDVKNFAGVVCTIRNGKIIFTSRDL